MPYVEINYNNGAITAFKPAFEEAQLFWNSLVTGGAQPVTVEEEIPLSRCGLEGTISKGETIPGLRIYASLKEIDGSKGIIASSGACISNGNFPMVGVLQVDTADTAELVRNGNLVDVVKRQIGIVFGIGSQWERRNLVTNPCTGDFGVCRGNPSYTGRFALEAFRELGGQVGEELVVSNTRGVGTWNTHWREDLLVNELMTSTLNMGMPNPFSKISAGALRDLGYSVNMNTAEDFLIPSQFQHPFAAEKVEMFGDILDFDMVDYRTLSVQEESLPGSDSDSSDDDSSVLNIDDDSDLTNEFAGMFGLMIIGFIAMAGMMFYSNKKQTAALKNFAASMKAGSSDNRVGTKNNLYIEP